MVGLAKRMMLSCFQGQTRLGVRASETRGGGRGRRGSQRSRQEIKPFHHRWKDGGILFLGYSSMLEPVVYG